jgi:hypothetical protein
MHHHRTAALVAHPICLWWAREVDSRMHGTGRLGPSWVRLPA